MPYDLTILDGVGWANGINDSGEVVGIGSTSGGAVYCGSWWIPGPTEYGLQQTSQGEQLFKVDNAGDAIGVPDQLFNINTEATVASLSDQFFGPYDLNNAYQILGEIGDRVAIYNWNTSSTVLLDPLPGQIGIEASCINNYGDVVGSSGGQGFLYSGGVMSEVVNCGFFDINDHKLAVGESAGAPAYVDLSQANPQLQLIPLPTAPAPPPGFGAGWATAVNAGRIIVGLAPTQVTPFAGVILYTYPFVYQAGQFGAAANLNDLIYPPTTEWYLSDAFDINEAGQIVGTAWGSDGAWRPYVATPRSAPLWFGAVLNGLVSRIIFGVTQGGGGLVFPGGPVPPSGPEAWLALPLHQREALLSFAISNLADLMGDRKARSQIQRIAVEAASRAVVQGARLQTPTLNAALKEQMEKARKRALGRLHR